MRTWAAGAAVAAFAAVLLAGCGSNGTGGSTASRTRTGTAPPGATTTASAVTRPQTCGRGAHGFFLPGPSHVRLEADSAGTGPNAVVFLHESGSQGMCGFWPYAAWLTAHHHVRAVLVNRCGYGATTCPASLTGDRAIVAETAPAAEWARAHGASRVTLVGGSAGASDALQAAGVVPHVAAVVAVSDDSPDTGGDDRTSARRIRVPTLLAVAPQDGLSPLADVREVYRLVPTAHKRLVVVTSLPGVHGWDLLTSASGVTPLARLIASWIAGRTS